MKRHFWLLFFHNFWIASIGLSANATLSLKTLSGNEVALKMNDDAVYVVQVWASWCVSCNRAVDQMHKTLAKSQLKNVKLVTVSIDESLEAANDYVKKHKDIFITNKILVLNDPNAELLKVYGLEGVPATLIFKGDKVIKNINGHPQEQDVLPFLLSH